MMHARSHCLLVCFSQCVGAELAVSASHMSFSKLAGLDYGLATLQLTNWPPSDP